MTILLDATTLLSVALLVFVGLRSRWTGRLVALLLLSPGLRYFSALFTFPIRLQLSEWAGGLLRLAGADVRAEGNVLIRQSAAGAPVEMAVDPACMGLQMTGVSLLVALFLLIWREKQTRKAVPVGWVPAYGLAAFGLTIVCNLFRIVLLVLFGAMPGTWAHEAIGLLCIVAYAWLPAWLLAGLLVDRFGRPDQQTAPGRPLILSAIGGLSLLALGFGIMAFTARPNEPDPSDTAQRWQRYFAGTEPYLRQPPAAWQQKTLPNGFVRLTKPGILIYLKPQTDWFSADHSPMTCWRGSGYELRQVRETVLNGHPAYIGELRRQGKTLYTAWWFSNGRTTTISQLTMRGRMLRGEPRFVLVNVTTANRKAVQ